MILPLCTFCILWFMCVTGNVIWSCLLKIMELIKNLYIYMCKHLNCKIVSFSVLFLKREQKKLNAALPCISSKKLKLSNYLCLFACKGFSFSPLFLVIQGKPINLLSILLNLSLNLKESFSTMSDYLNMIHFILEDVCMCLNINALEYPSWCIPGFMFVHFTVYIMTILKWSIIV